MTHKTQIDSLAKELSSIGRGDAFVSMRAILSASLEILQPIEDIRTHDVAVKYRKVEGFGGVAIEFDEAKAPFLEPIHDALDDPKKRFVCVKGPARVTKTTAAENYKLKIGLFGPPQNILWYLPTEPVAKRYEKERVRFFFDHHPDVDAKLEKKPRPSWDRKTVDGALWEYSYAIEQNLRMRAAPFIMLDEVDAMRPYIRNAAITLVRNRQREYGNRAKAYICSHPDAGPVFGIDRCLVDSDRRIRFWRCGDCGFLITPCPELEIPRERLVRWNMAELLEKCEGMPRDEVLDYVGENTHLVCPNCKTHISNEERKLLDADGIYIGKGQEILPDETVGGDLIDTEIAGFVLHGFMAPFVTISLLAREFVAGQFDFEETNDIANLKEVVCKSLGETYKGDDEASKPRQWKEVRGRIRDTGYSLGTIPRGVRFLTAFVDIQGDRFEAGVIGWNEHRESWLIDRFSIKQRLGLKDIDPADNIEDWDVIEPAVIQQVYPFAHDPDHGLIIAKTCVDTGGASGVTNNARIWAANLVSREVNPIELWRLGLLKGDAHSGGALYGTPRKVEHDNAERELPVPVYERTTNVTDIKKIIANRMAIENPGPGRMHTPKDLDEKYYRELAAETFINGMWLTTGGKYNETWDIWVGCDTARSLLAPDNTKIDWENALPSFSQRVNLSTYSPIGDTSEDEIEFFSRLRRLNENR